METHTHTGTEQLMGNKWTEGKQLLFTEVTRQEAMDHQQRQSQHIVEALAKACQCANLYTIYTPSMK